tara:strand:+ start:2440 stop:3339 length:900 start_codon:yes stop_codon:yes gene_type:complete
MLVEMTMFKHATYRATGPSMLGLMIMLCGVALYAFHDFQISYVGSVLILCHTTLLVLETLTRRQLLTEPTNPLLMTHQAMLFFNFSFGLLICLAGATTSGELFEAYDAMDELYLGERIYLLCAGLLAALFAYAGLKLTALVSATTLIVSTNASKVLLITFGILLLADESRPLAVVGAAMAIGGNLLYFSSRLKVRGHRCAAFARVHTLHLRRPRSLFLASSRQKLVQALSARTISTALTRAAASLHLAPTPRPLPPRCALGSFDRSSRGSTCTFQRQRTRRPPSTLGCPSSARRHHRRT